MDWKKCIMHSHQGRFRSDPDSRFDSRTIIRFYNLNDNYGMGERPGLGSGYGRQLTFKRSWVRIPAPYTGFIYIDLM